MTGHGTLPGTALAIAMVLAWAPEAAEAAPPHPVEPAMNDATSIPNFVQLSPRLMSAGQPGAGDWSTLNARGVRTVVNLRPAAEQAGRDEAAEVEAAGMVYVALPVDGAGGVTQAKADLLWSLVENAPADVLVHCATGNRVGALLALGAAARDGMAAEQAFAFGRAAGLGSLEPKVREMLPKP